MFVDYYQVLEISVGATSEEIKAAFKRLALKWHPDKNPGINTNEQMQLLNEAYLLLKDKEARERYNIEYQKYTHVKQQNVSKDSKSTTNESTYKNYVAEDEILKKWMDNAKKQAVDLAKDTIREMRELGLVSVKAASKEMAKYLIALLVLSIFFSIVFFISNQDRANDIPDVALIDTLQTKSLDSNIFYDISSNETLKRLFNANYINETNEAIWTPDQKIDNDFPISNNGFSYTALDSILYYEIENLSGPVKRALTIYITYAKDKDNTRFNCHACAPMLSYAIFEENPEGVWKLVKFKKKLELNGSWGRENDIIMRKYGKNKFYLDLSGVAMGQGYTEKWIRHYDFENEIIIYDRETETISNTGAVDDETIAFAYEIESKYIPSEKSVWDLQISVYGLLPDESGENVSPQNNIEVYSYDNYQKKYLLTENNSNQYFNTYYIKGVGVISVANDLELQDSIYREIGKAYRDAIQENLGITFNKNRIVFQQKGLNALTPESFQTYARLIIEITTGNDGSYADFNTWNLSSAELSELDEEFKREFEQQTLHTDMKLIAWYGSTIENINGIQLIKTSLLRQSENHPPVHVECYRIPNNDKIYTITLAYREAEKEKWQDILYQSLHTFHIVHN